MKLNESNIAAAKEIATYLLSEPLAGNFDHLWKYKFNNMAGVTNNKLQRQPGFSFSELYYNAEVFVENLFGKDDRGNTKIPTLLTITTHAGAEAAARYTVNHMMFLAMLDSFVGKCVSSKTDFAGFRLCTPAEMQKFVMPERQREFMCGFDYAPATFDPWAHNTFWGMFSGEIDLFLVDQDWDYHGTSDFVLKVRIRPDQRVGSEEDYDSMSKISVNQVAAETFPIAYQLIPGKEAGATLAKSNVVKTPQMTKYIFGEYYGGLTLGTLKNNLKEILTRMEADVK